MAKRIKTLITEIATFCQKTQELLKHAVSYLQENLKQNSKTPNSEGDEGDIFRRQVSGKPRKISPSSPYAPENSD